MKINKGVDNPEYPLPSTLHYGSEAGAVEKVKSSLNIYSFVPPAP
jgi:hypothetical protein